jgi:ATP-binding cassette subfamily B protein
MSTAVPSNISALIGTPQIRGHAVLLCAATDVDEAGHAAEQWLIITEREIAVVAEGDALRGLPTRCLRSYLLNEIQGSRVEAEVGSGYLQVKQGDVWIDVLRFSNKLSPKFRDIVQRLEQLRRHHEFCVPTSLDGEHECPRCGAPLKDADQRCPRCAPPAQTLRRVMQLLRPYSLNVGVIAGLCVLAVGIELVPPWLQKVLVDQILTGNSGESATRPLVASLAAIVCSLAVVRLVAACVSVWKGKLSSDIGTRLTADLRTQMVEKLQRLSVSYHDRNQVGMLMSRVSYDTEAMHTFMHQVSGGFLLQVMQLFASCRSCSCSRSAGCCS